MITWSFRQDQTYIPVLLNSMQLAQNPDLQVDKAALRRPVMKTIANYCAEKKQGVVLDFEGIDHAPDHGFEDFRELAKSTPLVFWDVQNETVKKAQIDCKDLQGYEIKAKSGNVTIITNEKGKNLVGSKGYRRKDIYDDYLRPYFISSFTDGERLLESSNVIANKYFNAKKLFVQAEPFHVACYRLARKMALSLPLADVHWVLASSYGGAVVASIIGQLLRKRVVYLVNLGPRLKLKQDPAPGDIGNQSGILITDMVCLGTELKIAQTAVASLGGMLSAAGSLVCYSRPKNVRFFSVVDLKDGGPFGYEIKVRKSGK